MPLHKPGLPPSIADPKEDRYGFDLTGADLQILGAMPFDPSRVSVLTLATMARLQRLGYVEKAADSGAWRLTAKGEMTKRLARRGPRQGVGRGRETTSDNG